MDNEWEKFAPHPLWKEWIPFIATLIGMITSLVTLMVTLKRNKL